MVEKDYVEIGRPTPMTAFIRKMLMAAKEVTDTGKPYCEPCARLDFIDKLESAQKESERIKGFVVENIQVEHGDLSKYGDESRFELLEDQEAFTDKVIEGSRTQVVMGHTMTYLCKIRGHKIGIFMSNENYAKYVSKTKVKSDKKGE